MQSRDAGRLYMPFKALALTPSPALAPHLSRSVSLTLMRFWLPNISKHEYVALSFIASHKSRANSTPAPDVTRVFVLQRSERKWLASTLCKRIVAVLLSGTGLIGSPLRCAVYHLFSHPFSFFSPILLDVKLSIYFSPCDTTRTGYMYDRVNENSPWAI